MIQTAVGDTVKDTMAFPCFPEVETFAGTDKPLRNVIKEIEGIQAETSHDKLNKSQLVSNIMKDDWRYAKAIVFAIECSTLIDSSLELKLGSFVRCPHMDASALVGIPSSTVFVDQQDPIRSRLEVLFNSMNYADFEDGMNNSFFDDLTMLFTTYGRRATNAMAYVIATNNADHRVIGEGLRWLGQIEHPGSYRSRLLLLERSLLSHSKWIRDGASLGLASMRDKHALPYLHKAIDSEKIPELKKDLELVLDALEH